MLQSEEAARRLGVKLPTLYAYVSRGLLPSHRSPDGRRSLFEAEEVEALARRSRGGRQVETRMATVTTAVTQLGDRGPAYRGRLAVDLVAGPAPAGDGGGRFEAAADLLWDAPPGGVGAWDPLPLRVPGRLLPRDRIRWAVVMAGAADRLRGDLRPEAVIRATRRLISSLVLVLGEPGGGGRPGPMGRPGSLAGRLAAALGAGPGPVAGVVDTALVLLADHELATSTVGVRVAASTRADLYDCLLAGLGVLGGPLHGGASELVHGLLLDAGGSGPEAALGRTLRWRGIAPGFGHGLYGQGDPRAEVLLGAVESIGDRARRKVVQGVVEVARDQGFPAPNVDMALAALTYTTGMAADAGQTIFTLARTAGWVAHLLEELDEAPLRFRTRAVYSAQPAGSNDQDASSVTS